MMEEHKHCLICGKVIGVEIDVCKECIDEEVKKSTNSLIFNLNIDERR